MIESITLPKSPVLSWEDFRPTVGRRLPAINRHPHAVITSSGRASLQLALQEMGLQPGDAVAVPTYHCPTMVAPVVLSGGMPVFYALNDQAQPKLQGLLDHLNGATLRAIIVPHLFGLPRDLHPVRQWCDQHRVQLIEDCAHTFIGMAGSRPVGGWGDYAAASVTKFLPVPEAGILLTPPKAKHSAATGPLSGWGMAFQLKAAFQVLERSLMHGRLWGLSHLVWPVHRLRSPSPELRRNSGAGQSPQTPVPGEPPAPQSIEQAIESCDMGRVHRQASWVAQLLTRWLPLEGLAAKRRRIFEQYRTGLQGMDRVRGLWNEPAPVDSAPYVFPLWVNDPQLADVLYHSLRTTGHAVFRWDRWWPHTPAIEADCGHAWRRQVIQLLTHQSLKAEDITHTLARIRELVATHEGPQAAQP